jgi:hypothetical protein
VRGERLRENKNMYSSWVLVVGEENLGTLGLYVVASLGIEVWAEEAIAASHWTSPSPRRQILNSTERAVSD